MMRHVFICLAVCGILLTGARSSCAMQLEEYLDGHVVLANGDRMPARIVSAKDGQVEFGSTLFSEVVRLDSQRIRAMGFRSSKKPTPDTAELMFRLRDGSRITGRLESLDNESFEVSSSMLGAITLPTSLLLDISQVQRATDRIVYSALNSQPLGEAYRPEADGCIYVKGNEKEPLLISHKFDPNGGSVRFEFDAQQDADYSLVLRNPGGDSLVSISVAGQDLVVESNADLEFGEFPVSHGLARLTLHFQDGIFRLLDEWGQSVAKVRLNPEVPLSVSLENRGPRLALREIVIFPSIVSTNVWETPLQATAADQIQVRERSGQVRVAKTVEFEAGSWKVSDVDENVVALSAESLDRVWFGNGDSKATGRSVGEYLCMWSNGDRLYVRDLQLSKQQVSFDAGGVVVSQWRSVVPPSEIFVCDAQRAVAADRVQESDAREGFRLAISGIPFSGSYYWGDSQNPIRWQFQGFVEPVTLNIQKNIKIQRVAKEPRRVDPRSVDRVVLKDGSVIPCKVKLAQENQLALDSNQVGASTVPLDSIQCCFFEIKDQSWRERMTRETISRTLTVPRFSRDAGFEHVLIGTNGDLLRGNLVSIHDRFIEFESRYEVVRLEREHVAGFIAVSPLETESASAIVPASDVQSVAAKVDCGNDHVLVGQYVSLSSEHAVLDSAILGRMTIAGSAIRQIAFNSDLNDASDLLQFSDWHWNSPVDPRWEKLPQRAADANELLGKTAEDFEIPVLGDTRSFRLQDHEGKVVVLHFWQSSSRPSVLGFQQIQEVIQKFSPADVVFIAPNQGETASQVERYVDSQKWNPLAIGMDFDGEVAKKFKVVGIPHLTVVDRDGIIRWIEVGHSDKKAKLLEQRIRDLLGK